MLALQQRTEGLTVDAHLPLKRVFVPRRSIPEARNAKVAPRASRLAEPQRQRQRVYGDAQKGIAHRLLMLRLHGELSPPRDPAFAALVLRDVPLLRARPTPATHHPRPPSLAPILLPPCPSFVLLASRSRSAPILLRPPDPRPHIWSSASRVLLPALLPSPGLLASSHSSISCSANAGVWGTDDERCSKERSQRQRSRRRRHLSETRPCFTSRPAPHTPRACSSRPRSRAPPRRGGRQTAPPVRWRSLFASSRLLPPPSSPHPEHHIIEGEVGTPACASCPHRASHRASQEPTHVVQSCAVEVESEVEFSSKERCSRAPSPPWTSASETTPVVSSPPLPSLARATQHIP
ncbi:hypothetical protein DFH09DRAFT_1366706 [Mycena vulgaris]|nr:hypothetical protein DFH09DRAFT_1366706 [Mycena vulgaris]